MNSNACGILTRRAWLAAPLLAAVCASGMSPDATAQQAPAPSAPPAIAAPPSMPPAPSVAPPPAEQPPTGLETGAPAQSAPASEPIAEPAQPPSAARPDASLPHDLSAWGMFEAAGPVVKGVMVGLALASVITWTVALAKGVEIALARRRLRRSLRDMTAAPSLADARRAGRADAAARMVGAVWHEIDASEDALDRNAARGLLDRVASRLSRIEAAEGRRLTRGTGALATIGATAPFIGLFGTVWGIMNSFIGISESQTTNLAVVAPGIAEALLATAMGLVAAIPAVVCYNHFARSIAACRAMLADVAAAVERLVSRDLDHRRLPAQAQRLAAE